MSFRSRLANWFSAFQAKTPTLYERREPLPRQPLSLNVRCRHRGKEFEARVLDFSPQGMKISCARLLEAEDTVEIDSTDHRQHVLGRVAWVKGQHGDWIIGVQFNPSDENVIEEWLTLAAISQSA
ncbi:PilZ domain-containing protein [bacterium]|nr:PilZ domain-containing protein [bacterium]